MTDLAIRDRNEYRRKLEANGFKLLGAGFYSMVFAYPNDTTRVLKLGTDDTWEPYVRWATENGFAGNYAPRVYAYKRLSHWLYLASMERLDSTVAGIQDERERHDTMDAIFDVQRGHEEGYRFVDIKWPGLRCFVKRAQYEGFTGDWHMENWMVKGPRLVLIDPQSENRTSPKRWRAVGPTIQAGR